MTPKVAALDQTVRGFEKDLQDLQYQKTALTTTLADLRQKGEAARLESQEYSLKAQAL